MMFVVIVDYRRCSKENWMNDFGVSAGFKSMEDAEEYVIYLKKKLKCDSEAIRIDSFDIQESLDDLKEMRSEHWVDDALNKRRR